MDRYSKQILFEGIGREGQRRLGASSVVIIGCGALGTMIATALVRAGVGKVKIIDRDFIEYHNLQRQVLFDEDDIQNQLPKAVAAERHLQKINSSVKIEGIVADVNYTNIEKFIQGTDLILDGLDNLETRYLVNDASLKHRIPWIYGGAAASFGMTMNVIPGETPCLRCLYPNSNIGGTAHNCDTVGVIGPAPFIVGSIQSSEAMKILVGEKTINRDVLYIDIWEGTFKRFSINRRPDCPACNGKFDFLETRTGARATSLCGQNAIQVTNPEVKSLSLEKLAAHLKPVGEVSYNEFLLRFKVDNQEMVVFPDGRAIIKNTADESLAKGLYARYIGL